MNRKTALENLIQFNLPIEQSVSDLAQFEWDSEIELVSLEAAQIQNALQLFTQGAISALEVEAWANAIECRDDIKIETSLVNEALHEFANPYLTQSLSVERASFWLSQAMLTLWSRVIARIYPRAAPLLNDSNFSFLIGVEENGLENDYHRYIG